MPHHFVHRLGSWNYFTLRVQRLNGLNSVQLCEMRNNNQIGYQGDFNKTGAIIVILSEHLFLVCVLHFEFRS